MAVSLRFDLRRLGPRQAGAVLLEPRFDAVKPGLGLHLHATKEFRPGYPLPAAHIVLVHVQNLHRRETNARASENMSLQAHIVVMMVLDLAAAFHFAHSPIAARQTFQR